MRDAPAVDTAVARPARQLRPFVVRYVGYRYEGFAPGTHLGLPSRHLTLVITLGEPLRLTMPGVGTDDYVALVSGLHTRAVKISHDGNQFGVQLDLTPPGARALLRTPAAELAAIAVDLDAVLGPATSRLVDQMASAPDWPYRFNLLDQTLSRHLIPEVATPAAELVYAWRRIVQTGGRVQVSDIATEVGWSRRHLGGRFVGEYGLTPKELARVTRFERSRWLLQSPLRLRLADVAARCGYYDQAHLARDWNDIAGCPPSVWLASEEFPSVQDEERPAGAR